MVMAKVHSSINSADILNFLDANEIHHFITPLFIPLFHYSTELSDGCGSENGMNYVSSQSLFWMVMVNLYLFG